MKSLNYQERPKLTYNRLLCLFLLFLWLFSTSIAIVHAQQHTLTQEIDCQICLTNANHTPIITVSTLSVLPQPQINVDIECDNPLIMTKRCLLICNRDPPSKTIL